MITESVHENLASSWQNAHVSAVNPFNHDNFELFMCSLTPDPNLEEYLMGYIQIQRKDDRYYTPIIVVPLGTPHRLSSRMDRNSIHDLLVTPHSIFDVMNVADAVMSKFNRLALAVTPITRYSGYEQVYFEFLGLKNISTVNGYTTYMVENIPPNKASVIYIKKSDQKFLRKRDSRGDPAETVSKYVKRANSRLKGVSIQPISYQQWLNDSLKIWTPGYVSFTPA